MDLEEREREVFIGIEDRGEDFGDNFFVGRGECEVFLVAILELEEGLTEGLVAFTFFEE